MVGTTENVRKNDASIASTTVMASGMNRNRAGPVSSTTGKNTMQIANVATVSGVTTSWQPSRMEMVSDLPSDWLRWMFSMVTVALSTSRPMASASPPSVIRLMVCPKANRPAMPAKIDSGMDTETITVFRQLPRNSRIISDTRIEEMIASRTTFSMAALTNTD